jgi:hypothetical protein
MQQAFAELSWTGSIGTTRHCLTHRPVGLGVTGRAVGGHAKGEAVRRTGFEEHTHHLRNYVSSALDENLITYTDVFAPNFVFVV